MSKREKHEAAIVDAAFQMAATRAWNEVKLADIAAEAEMPLSELAGLIGGKADILRFYGRQLDARMLASLETEPVTGTPHDRVFDILMRRLELMDADKAAIRSIMQTPAATLTGYATLAGSLLQSQDWVLTAAGLEDSGLRGAMKSSGLAMVYVRTLRVWVNDDDAGLARTMAQLDRSLRDGADWIKRLEAPMTLATALSSLARGFMKARNGPAPQPDTTAQTEKPAE
jgi:ubiquinone biosynthesis protein COQ9